MNERMNVERREEEGKSFSNFAACIISVYSSTILVSDDAPVTREQSVSTLKKCITRVLGSRTASVLQMMPV